MIVKRTESQRKAEKKYNEKRLKQPAIPAIRLSNDESELVEQAFEKFGKTKKEAVLAGLKLLLEQ